MGEGQWEDDLDVAHQRSGEDGGPPGSPRQVTRWADIVSAADHLATTERHLRRLVYERRIPFTKLGGKVRFDLDEVDRYLKERSISTRLTR